MRLKIVKSAVALSAVFLLASCSAVNSEESTPIAPPTSEPTRPGPSEISPGEITVTHEEAPETAIKPNIQGGNIFYVTEDPTVGYLHIGGSGSCPPVIKLAAYQDDFLAILMDSEAYAEQACTADFTMYPHKFTALNGREFTPEMKVVLDFGTDRKAITVRKLS